MTTVNETYYNTSLDATAFHTNIELPFGELASVVAWCKVQCRGTWCLEVRREAGIDPGLYCFSFKSEADYVNFLLWKK